MHYEKEEYVGNTSTQIHSRVWAFKIFNLFSYMICEKVDRIFYGDLSFNSVVVDPVDTCSFICTYYTDKITNLLK